MRRWGGGEGYRQADAKTHRWTQKNDRRTDGKKEKFSLPLVSAFHLGNQSIREAERKSNPRKGRQSIMLTGGASL